MTKPFRTLSEFAIHKERIRIESNYRKRVLDSHFEALQDPKVRKDLTKNSASHLVDSFEPLRLARSVLSSAPGAVGAAALLFSLTGKHPIAKAVGSIATFAGPLIWARLQSSDSGTEPEANGIPHRRAMHAELGESLSRIKRYVRRRQEDRSQTT